MRFDLLFGVGDGVGEAFFDFGEAVGVGVGVAFFFRCLRDELGVGSGSKVFLIFVPNDSWAEGAASTAPNKITPNKITRIRSHFIIRRCSVRYSGENRVQYFRRMPSGQRSLQHVNEIGRLATASQPGGGQDAAGPTDKMSVLRLRELLQDCFVQANPAFEIFERKIFVR